MSTTIPALDPVTTIADNDVVMITHSNGITEKITGANLKAAINAGKADKVSSATANNLASLNASGNLTDSGINKQDLPIVFKINISAGKQRTITLSNTGKIRIEIGATASNMNTMFFGSITGYSVLNSDVRSMCCYYKRSNAINISDINTERTFTIGNEASSTVTVFLTLYGLSTENISVGNEANNTITAMGSTWQKLIIENEINGTNPIVPYLEQNDLNNVFTNLTNNSYSIVCYQSNTQNAPDSQGGLLITSKREAAYGTQLALNFQGLYIRKYGNGWSAWSLIK